MNNKAHLRPQDYDSNGDIIPMACKEEKGDLISREALKKALKEYKYCGFYDKVIEIIDPFSGCCTAKYHILISIFVFQAYR